MALSMFKVDLRPAQYTTPTNQELQLALGATTFVHMTSTGALAFCGLAATGGNVDGMVVCLSNENAAGSLTFNHEDTANEPTATNRFRCTSLVGAAVNQGGAIWFRYNVTTSRWHQMGKC